MNGRMRPNGWRICGDRTLTFQKVTVSNRLSQSCEVVTRRCYSDLSVNIFTMTNFHNVNDQNVVLHLVYNPIKSLSHTEIGTS